LPDHSTAERDDAGYDARMSDDAPLVTAPAARAEADPSMYSAFYYEHDCGVPYERNEHWIAFFSEIARRIVLDIAPRRVLDAGCAMGLLVEQLVNLGVDAFGIDISEYAISQVPEAVVDRCRLGSITDPIDGRYDLVVCIEVIEHLLRDDAEKAIDNLCAVSDAVLFASTPHDYAEPTHVNVQPPDVWSEMFARRGYYRDLDHEPSYITPWASLYRRSDARMPELVRAYERRLWQETNEIDQLRHAVIAMQAKLQELAESGNGANSDINESKRLEEELVETRMNLLKTRDLVAGLEATMGTVAGERDHWLRYAASRQTAFEAYEEMQNSKAWRGLMAVLRPYRRAVNTARRVIR
jgi:SAM-dependent methyltransferase